MYCFVLYKTVHLFFMSMDVYRLCANSRYDILILDYTLGENDPERRILQVFIKRLELWENTTKLLGVKGMTANVIQVVASAATTATSTVTEATTEGKLDKIFQSSEKASELSYSIMNIIYILAAMIIVVAIFTVVLYIYKFIMNRRDPNYKKNDDTFLDD